MTDPTWRRMQRELNAIGDPEYQRNLQATYFRTVNERDAWKATALALFALIPFLSKKEPTS